MKKIAWILGGFVGVVLVSMVAIPFFVEVDKYRPEIVKVANENLNGRLELGKLKLTLWGKIKIEIGGVKLTGSKNEEVLKVDDAYFHLPLMSLLSGSPELNLRMQKPEVFVEKDKAGKLNLMSLVKKESVSAPATGTPPASSASSSGTPPSSQEKKDQSKGAEKLESKPVSVTVASSEKGAPELPGIAARARLGFEMRDAFVSYRDLGTGVESKIQNFNILVHNLSLSKEMDLEVWADLSTQMGTDLDLNGPMKITGKAKPNLVENRLESVAAELKADFDGVEIKKGTLFKKAKGMAMNMDLALRSSEKVLEIEKLVLKFFNAEVKAHVKVIHPATTSPEADPTVKASVVSNEIDLKSWEQLIPMLDAYELQGKMKLDVLAEGPSSKLNAKGKFTVDGLKAKAPELKVQPQIDLLVSFAPDQLDRILLTFKAPANDVKLEGKMVSFTKPKLDLSLSSAGMDLTQLIDFDALAKKSKKEALLNPLQLLKVSEAFAEEKRGSKPVDQDAALDSLRQSKMMGDFVAQFNGDIKFIKGPQWRLDDFKTRFVFKDLEASLQDLSFKTFGGTIKMNGASQLRPKTPTYQFMALVEQFDLKQAVEANVAMFKNTLLGKAGFSIKGTGASFNPDPMLKSLNAKGTFKVTQAKFASIDIGKMVKEGVNGALAKVGDKIPKLKGRQINGLPNGESKYESISSDFTIEKGVFSAPNFFAKAEAQKGVDIKGSLTVGLLDQKLDTSWLVIDTYNMTKAHDISVDEAGVKVDHLLAEGNDPVKFPVNAGCTTTAPCYSYTQVPEYFAKVALGNVSKAVSGKAKTEVKKKVEQLIEQKAPPALKDKLKKFGGGLFGN